MSNTRLERKHTLRRRSFVVIGGGFGLGLGRSHLGGERVIQEQTNAVGDFRRGADVYKSNSAQRRAKARLGGERGILVLGTS